MSDKTTSRKGAKAQRFTDDTASGLRGIFEWVEPTVRLPLWAGKYLVMTSNGPEIVEIHEQTNPTYEPSGDIADPEEWEAWSEIPKVNILRVVDASDLRASAPLREASAPEASR